MSHKSNKMKRPDTITALAKKMDVGRPELSELLSGKRKAGAIYARKIAAYLNQPESWSRFYHMPGDELRRMLMEKK